MNKIKCLLTLRATFPAKQPLTNTSFTPKSRKRLNGSVDRKIGPKITLRSKHSKSIDSLIYMVTSKALVRLKPKFLDNSLRQLPARRNQVQLVSTQEKRTNKVFSQEVQINKLSNSNSRYQWFNGTKLCPLEIKTIQIWTIVKFQANQETAKSKSTASRCRTHSSTELTEISTKWLKTTVIRRWVSPGQTLKTLILHSKWPYRAKYSVWFRAMTRLVKIRNTFSQTIEAAKLNWTSLNKTTRSRRASNHR